MERRIKGIPLCWHRYGMPGVTLKEYCISTPKMGTRVKKIPTPIDWGKIKPFSKEWGFLVHCGMFPDHERKKLQKKYGKYLEEEYLI